MIGRRPTRSTAVRRVYVTRPVLRRRIPERWLDEHAAEDAAHGRSVGGAGGFAAGVHGEHGVADVEGTHAETRGGDGADRGAAGLVVA